MEHSENIIIHNNVLVLANIKTWQIVSADKMKILVYRTRFHFKKPRKLSVAVFWEKQT
jgi:hypothetical protein